MQGSFCCFSWDPPNYNITESKSVTDKLWLPSTNEIFGTSPNFKDCDESSLGSLHYATRLSAEQYAGSEGITYDNYEFNKVYNEAERKVIEKIQFFSNLYILKIIFFALNKVYYFSFFVFFI